MKKYIKNDFPIFSAQAHKKPFVFLDSAATSQMPQAVISAITEYYTAYKANTHSGIYTIGARTVEACENARMRVAAFIHANAEEIIFTSGATASLNMLAYLLEPHIATDDEIVVSTLEHHSNFIPWQELAKRSGAMFTVLPLEHDGTLSLETVRKHVSKRTKIVAVTHVSHVLGIVNNMQEICKIAHDAGAWSIVDAAQSMPHMPVNVRELDCDFLVFSGHKLMGPTGIGVLYGKGEHLEKLSPVIYGGGMIRDVNTKTSHWADIPAKFEAGTPHIAGIVGLGCAISYIEQIGKKEIKQHESELAAAVRSALLQIPEVTLYGPEHEENTAGIISFTITGVHPHDVAEILSHENIAIRAGHHCALPLMKHFGISGTVRASFYVYNTMEDVERLIEGVKHLIDKFRTH